jgi:hypothetical protein
MLKVRERGKKLTSIGHTHVWILRFICFVQQLTVFHQLPSVGTGKNISTKSSHKDKERLFSVWRRKRLI